MTLVVNVVSAIVVIIEVLVINMSADVKFIQEALIAIFFEFVLPPSYSVDVPSDVDINLFVDVLTDVNVNAFAVVTALEIPV